MTSRPGSSSPAARCRRCLSIAAALLAAAPAWAASSGAFASATIVEPAEINRMLGLPASAIELYLRQRGPAGPQTGSVLIRVIGGVGDVALAVQVPQPASVDTSLTLTGGTAVLGHGLAMAVMASMSSEEQGRDDSKPVAITVAFN